MVGRGEGVSSVGGEAGGVGGGGIEGGSGVGAGGGESFRGKLGLSRRSMRVIENGNMGICFYHKLLQENGALVTKMSVHVIAEEKTNKKNDVKAISLLLMALPNEHQLTFSQYDDAKTMFASIETQFGVHQAQSNRLQKIVSRLAILGVVITQEDLNSKFLRSLPPEWNTHVKYVGTSTDAQNLAFMTALSTSSTNDVNTAKPAYEVSTVSPNVNTTSHQDLEQIHEDDLEAMDLKWQLSLLSIRAKRWDNFAGNILEQKEQRGVKEQVKKNMALMVFLDSEVYNDKTCTKTCLKNYKTLKKQSDDLIVMLNQTEFIAATYKRGLATVEEQLISYRKNEVLFSEEVAILKREVACKDYEINGLGYNDVPPPHPLIYNRPKKLDLSYSGLDEFKDPEFKSYGSKDKQVSEDTSSFVDSPLNVDKETAKAVNTARLKAVNIVRSHSAVVNAVRFNQANVVKASAYWVWRPTKLDSASTTLKKHNYIDARGRYKSISRNLMEVMLHLGEEHLVVRIVMVKGTLKTDSLDFEDVYFVNELKFNLFSVSQMCDKKNYVLFTDTECLVLSPNFKLPDESQILLKIPRKDNMYSFDMKNIVPKESLTCLVAKATSDESMLWHRRLGHINFKNINKLVKDNLVRGLPTKRFENDQTCVACLKGKQHKASCTFTQKEEISQDCIVMPIWKDASYFVSPSKDVGNGEPNSAADDQKQVEDGPHNESEEKDKSEDDSSPKEVNAAGQHVNTASPEVNTGHFKLNIVDPSVNTASSYELDSPKDMFKLGASHTLETTHVEFFSDEDEPEVDLGNITNSYTVPTTPNTRIHKDHPILNPQALLKHYLIHLGWKQCRKNFCNSSSNRNKARLVAQDHRQEEGIYYEEVFAPVARIDAIRLFLAYASFMGFLVYQMDVKSAFLYRTIEEEVYVTQPPGFKDPDHPDKVYKVVKALYGLHQAPRACQDKYVAEILKKFNYTDVKSASTPVDLENPLVKDRDADDVDVHLYRSLIGSLMYLTTSRPDIIYLKGKPTLGLWYSRDSPFELVAYTDSDYARATQDRKSTTEGCQFLGNRLISWQCKKQTVVATFTTKAKYVAAASCCGQIFLQKVLMLEGMDIEDMDKNQSKNGQSQTRKGKSAQEPGIIKLWSTKLVLPEEKISTASTELNTARRLSTDVLGHMNLESIISTCKLIENERK
ncbi:ribonuclease H-like domain-containing protein [Tanacetum coccineum]